MRPSSDYSVGSVNFNSGDHREDDQLHAASDSDTDDGESVKLTLRVIPARGVSSRNQRETVVSITDDDVPSVR